MQARYAIYEFLLVVCSAARTESEVLKGIVYATACQDEDDISFRHFHIIVC